MAEPLALRCTVTGHDFPVDDWTYFNPAVGQAATLDVIYDMGALRATLDRDALAANPDRSMWRWRPLLPLPDEGPVPPLAVGGTPLYDAPRLARALGLASAWVKDDGANPTGSLKDRASAMVVARAMHADAPVVATASTGNAAAALAGVCASVEGGPRAVIFVPASAPEAKIAQLLVYGAQVLLVEGSYDTAFDLCTATCAEHGWVCRNTGLNPFTSEGKKTAAFEIAEGLGWQAPDAVLVSVGDGSIISGLHKGFGELVALGWLPRLPRMIGVQAEDSAVLAHAWRAGLRGEDVQPGPATTLADSISAELPRDRVKALRAVRATSGGFVTVPETQILASIPLFARATGVFAEPSAAIVYAGAQCALREGLLRADDRVLFLATGNGLKDVRRAQQSVVGAVRVQPTRDAVRAALSMSHTMI